MLCTGLLPVTETGKVADGSEQMHYTFFDSKQAPLTTVIISSYPSPCFREKALVMLSWKLPLLGLTLLFGSFVVVNAFSPAIPSYSRQEWYFSTQKRFKKGIAGVFGRNDRSLTLQNSLTSEIFLLAFDGAVAKTTEWRISQGIDLALMTWPHLKDFELISQHEDDKWLRNKMRALSSVLISRPGASLACDYALLARLLIEEQNLDQGRSNGKTGKYASKFHPKKSSAEGSNDTNLNPDAPGSRPLTVGEIGSNWNTGGCLADTVLTKYHVNYKNPLPILQENVERLEQEQVGVALSKMICIEVYRAKPCHIPRSYLHRNMTFQK
jgi:hypothetical protein